jgi:hypothetical protein
MFIASTSQALRASGDSLRNRFTEEAPIAWKEAANALKDLELEVADSVHNRSTEGDLWHRRKIVVKVRDAMALYEMGDWDSGNHLTRGRVHAINKQGSFTLRREEDLPWAVGFMAPGRDKIIARSTDNAGQSYVSWPWRVGGTHVPELCGATGFHLADVSEVAAEGKTFARIAFSYDRPDEQIRTRDGWIDLDPNAAWSVARCDVRLESKNDAARLVLENAYAPGSDVVPLRSVVKIIHDNAVSEHTVEFTKYDRHVVPEADFTMAAYGIDMPIGMKPQPRRALPLVLALSIVFLAAGIVFLRRSRGAAAGG